MINVESWLERNIWEYIEPYLVDRNGRSYIQNEEYNEAVKKADIIFQKLHNTLNKQQVELLEQYSCATNSTNAVVERLLYRQGMKDMLVLLISLLKSDGKNNI